MFSRKCQPPPRIERWVARLMPYKFNIEYQAGHLNSADYLSRSNPVKLHNSSTNMRDTYINMIAINSTPNSLSLKDIQHEPARDTQK